MDTRLTQHARPFLQVVPTEYLPLKGDHVVEGNQYSVTEYFMPSSMQPGGLPGKSLNLHLHLGDVSVRWLKGCLLRPDNVGRKWQSDVEFKSKPLLIQSPVDSLGSSCSTRLGVGRPSCTIAIEVLYWVAADDCPGPAILKPDHA